MKNITKDQAHNVLNFMVTQWYCNEYGDFKSDNVVGMVRNPDGSICITLASGQQVLYVAKLFTNGKEE